LDSLRGSREGPDAEDLGIFGRREPTHAPLSSKDAVAGPSLAWSDLARVEARLQDRSLSLEERQRLKDMKHWRMTRGRPELPPEKYEEVANLALEFAETRIRVEELARDPDHRGAVTPNSILEARIALVMEREGRLREVIRDPRTGCGDLIERDGAGQEWDVYSPIGESFHQEKVAGELSDKLDNQRQDERMMKVIVNCAFLSREQVGEIEKIVEMKGWRGLVAYGTSQLSG
jgi:hypothetical protein